MIQLSDTWSRELCEWAQKTAAVKELWLFGSRARGEARAESDVDLALVLMPSARKHDWASGDYVALHSEWKNALEAIVGRHVSLEAITPDTPGDRTVRETGIRLWSRSEPQENRPA
jgi:predicted nucleotidyltransferase